MNPRRRSVARWTMVALAGMLVASLLTTPATADKSGPKFENGTWNLTFAATINWSAADIQSSNLSLGGQGKFEVVKGSVAGTFEAGGPGTYVAHPPQTLITWNGTYFWRGGKVVGSAADPDLSANAIFEGITHMETVGYSASTSGTTDNGPVAAALVIESANPKVVTGHIEIDGDFVGITSNFFAHRNCPRSKAPEYLDKRIRPGTADNPTRVQVFAHQSITRSKDLKAALDAALQGWNAMTEAAGKHIVFQEAPGNGPKVYVGIDSTVFRDQVGPMVGGEIRPMKDTQAGHADHFGGTGTDFENATVRLANHTNTPTSWYEYVRKHPQEVEGIFKHEIGHAMGLGHEETDKDAIMFDTHQKDREPTAGCSDLRALEQL